MEFYTEDVSSASLGGAVPTPSRDELGLSEISNTQQPRPSKRQLAKPRTGLDDPAILQVAYPAEAKDSPSRTSGGSRVSVVVGGKPSHPVTLQAPPHQPTVLPFATAHALPPTATPPPNPAEQQLLSRWYQLIGEMQCLMAQMQQHGITPPQPFPGMPPFTPVAVPSSVAQPAPGAKDKLPATQGQGPQSLGPASAVSVSVGVKPSGGASTASTPTPQLAHSVWDELPAVEEEGRKGRSRSNSSEPAPFVALVEFKRQRIRRFEATLFVNPGEYVIVDGDRGTDCGFVVQCSVRNPDGTFGRTESIDNTPIDATRVKAESGRIHRVASPEEIDVLHGELASMERFALGKCRQFVTQMHLRMEVVDCEFQFDRKKVTFFFDSAEAVDFRELTKDLYRFFGTRIWLENINSKVKNVVPDGALSHVDKLMYAQRGLRPPRR